MTTFDYAKLTQLLDRTKTHVFLTKDSAFLAALMCRLEFRWDERVQTAAASGVKVAWNPQFFLDLVPDTRRTVLVHELWHPANLDGLRMGARDPELWNIACDIRINNQMTAYGYRDSKGVRHEYSWEGIEWVVRNEHPEIQALGLRWASDVSAEQIYDDLKTKLPPTHTLVAGFGPPGSPGGDMEIEGDDGAADAADKTAQDQQVLNAVLQAATVAKMSADGAGSIPGDLEAFLDTFLEPVVPWEVLLERFFSDLQDLDYDWRVRDRRYSDVYLPGEVEDEGRLAHLAWITDVSGSFDDDQLIRVNSEVKHLWEKYQPSQMTLVQFDTKIQDVRELTEGDHFDGLHVHGRGGTNLEPVRQWINQHQPTAAIIFTDLDCRPMAKLDREIPIIWLCVDNPGKTVPFGTLLHIES